MTVTVNAPLRAVLGLLADHPNPDRIEHMPELRAALDAAAHRLGFEDRHQAAALYHQKVRFQAAKGGRWKLGHISGINDDGSFTVIEAKQAKTRCFHSDRLETARRGPRGGEKWVPVEQVLSEVVSP